jgi:hypothetical protein
MPARTPAGLLDRNIGPSLPIRIVGVSSPDGRQHGAPISTPRR